MDDRLRSPTRGGTVDRRSCPTPRADTADAMREGVSAGAIESKGSWLSSREVSLNGFLGMEGLGAT